MAVLVKGHGHVHAPLPGLGGHEDIGQIVGALDAGQIVLLRRDGAGKGREALFVKGFRGQFLAQGHDVEAGPRAFLGRDAETAGPAEQQSHHSCQV